MHDIRWIRDHPEAFDRGLARRGLAGEAGRLIAIDEGRRAAIARAEGVQARRNAASKEIGEAKKAKDEARAKGLMAEVADLKAAIDVPLALAITGLGIWIILAPASVPGLTPPM